MILYFCSILLTCTQYSLFKYSVVSTYPVFFLYFFSIFFLALCVLFPYTQFPPHVLYYCFSLAVFCIIALLLQYLYYCFTFEVFCIILLLYFCSILHYCFTLLLQYSALLLYFCSAYSLVDQNFKNLKFKPFHPTLLYSRLGQFFRI